MIWIYSGDSVSPHVGVHQGCGYCFPLNVSTGFNVLLGDFVSVYCFPLNVATGFNVLLAILYLSHVGSHQERPIFSLLV
jgi:hypothetical protein